MHSFFFLILLSNIWKRKILKRKHRISLKLNFLFLTCFSGTKDSTGRPVIVIHGSTIVKDGLNRNDTAKMLLYYATLLGKSQTERGVTVLLTPDSQSEKEDDCLFDLLDQAFDLVKKYLKINVVYALVTNSPSVNQRWLKSIVFPRANIKVILLRV